MTPISSSEPWAGKRHFSLSRPALDLLMATSPRLWRLPMASQLYVGQSFGASPARPTGLSEGPRPSASRAPDPDRCPPDHRAVAYASDREAGGRAKGAL